MAYDDILIHLGEFGHYQRRIYLLLCIPAISCALHKLAGVFLQAKVDHRCLLPFEQENATFNSIEFLKYKEFYPWDNIAKNFSKCLMYDTNYTHSSVNQKSIFDETVDCHSWVYDKSKYESSTVIEWDLVCDKAWLKATSDAFFMLGVMLGSIIFGDLSDRYGYLIFTSTNYSHNFV
uniref:Major facilitator superfamily (MFS) profile domain-containing protein n=1 Tax=Clastoptera arizonana TaxID=38151 RepID=A0A1B6D0T7_9HEMI